MNKQAVKFEEEAPAPPKVEEKVWSLRKLTNMSERPSNSSVSVKQPEKNIDEMELSRLYRVISTQEHSSMHDSTLSSTSKMPRIYEELTRNKVENILPRTIDSFINETKADWGRT